MGENRGIMAFNKMVTQENGAMAQKDNIRNENMGCFNCDPEWLKKSAESGKKMGKFFGMATGCCSCLPMHVSKLRPIQEAEKQRAKQAYDQVYS